MAKGLQAVVFLLVVSTQWMHSQAFLGHHGMSLHRPIGAAAAKCISPSFQKVPMGKLSMKATSGESPLPFEKQAFKKLCGTSNLVLISSAIIFATTFQPLQASAGTLEQAPTAIVHMIPSSNSAARTSTAPTVLVAAAKTSASAEAAEAAESTSLTDKIKLVLLTLGTVVSTLYKRSQGIEDDKDDKNDKNDK